MEIGNKILELRKNAKLSQEQLAEKINVTRQTISKWELNETTPDIKQAKELAKIFKISLDKLTDNDTNDLIMEKNLTNLIHKVAKYLGICFLVILIIDIISFIIFFIK